MSNTASIITANRIIVPASGFQVLGGPLSVSSIKNLTTQFIEYAAASTQPQMASNAEQEYLWNISSPLSQSGLTWLSASNWSYISATTGGASVFTPGANGLGLYFVTWEVSSSAGGCEYFINRNVAPNLSGTSTSAYGTNNMKGLVSFAPYQPGGDTISASILISSPTDFIAFGAYNNTANTITSGLNTTLTRTYLRIQKQ